MIGSRERLRAALPMRRRRALARALVQARRPTASLRALPDFLVIGAMRAGTSSLFRYLGEHPGVVPSVRKETEYFTLHHQRGLAWYRAHFPLRRPRALIPRRVTFEATPYYLFHPHAATRAAALLPEAKIVVLVRDPIARAVSHHRHMSRLGLETLPFDQAIAAEPTRLAPEIARLDNDPLAVSMIHHRWSYVARGRYMEQLDRWLGAFDRHRVFVMPSDDLYDAPAPAYARLLEFLELDPFQPAAFENHSVASDPSAAIDAVVRAQLVEEFTPHNRRLYDFLGRDLNW